MGFSFGSITKPMGNIGKSLGGFVTDRVDSYDPVWSPDGQWLYFLSDRSFSSVVGSPWGPRQPEPFFDRTTKIYMMGLKEEFRSPFRPEARDPGTA